MRLTPLKVRSRRAGTFPSTFTAAPSATEVVTGCFPGRAASTWRGWAGPLTQAKAFCRLPSPGPGLASPYLRPTAGPRTSSIPQGFGLRSLRDAFAGHENTHLPGESFWGSRGGAQARWGWVGLTLDVAPWLPTGSNANSLPPSSPPSARCPLPVRQMLQRRLCGLCGAEAGQSWLPWGVRVQREQLGKQQLQGCFPKSRTHLRRDGSQPGPARLRSIAIRAFKTLPAKSNPGLIWLWKSSPGPRAAMTVWLSALLLDTGSPVQWVCHPLGATQAGTWTAPSLSLHVCEVG